MTGERGAVAWMRRNLFANRRDTVLTIIAGLVVGFVVYRALRFVFVTGRWDIIRDNLSLFMVGRYPRDELWRLALAVMAVGFAGGAVAGVVARRRADAGQVDERNAWERGHDVVLRTWPVLVVVVLLLLLSTTITPWLVALGALVAIVCGRLLGGALGRRAGLVLVAVAAAVPVVMLRCSPRPSGGTSGAG